MSQDGSRHLVDYLGPRTKPFDIYLLVIMVVPVSAHHTHPLLAEHDGHTVQVQLLSGTAGALLEGLDDPQSVVGPPLELEVRLELADHAVASALDRPFGYDRAVVAYPERDSAFEGGAVPGHVCRVPHHVGG